MSQVIFIFMSQPFEVDCIQPVNLNLGQHGTNQGSLFQLLFISMHRELTIGYVDVSCNNEVKEQ